jgi:hypothetical protein
MFGRLFTRDGGVAGDRHEAAPDIVVEVYDYRSRIWITSTSCGAGSESLSDQQSSLMSCGCSIGTRNLESKALRAPRSRYSGFETLM